MTDQQGTTDDATYNLISVTYHALQAVDTLHTFARDAEESGDTELSSLLQEAIGQQRSMAGRAKDLLSQRLSQGSTS